MLDVASYEVVSKGFSVHALSSVETSSPLTTKSFELSVEFQNTLIEIPNALETTRE